MRHVRMLGLCLVAAFALAAVSASSALAIKNPTNSKKIFINCPVDALSEAGFPDAACIVAATEIGEKGTSAGGKFTVGPITVPIEKQIILQYGLAENLETGALEYLAPTHGVPAILPTPEKVPGEPIGHITPAEQEELGWPESLKYSYAQAKKKGLVKHVTETIEVAGNPATNDIAILVEEGTGVEAPVKIKGENAWLSRLGDVCYIGSEAEPIVQHLTTGPSESPLTHEVIHGAAGSFLEPYGNEELILSHSILVDNTYAVPAAACTGPYSAVIAATIDKEFGIPAAAGASVTEIKGTLYQASRALAIAGGA